MDLEAEGVAVAAPAAVAGDDVSSAVSAAEARAKAGDLAGAVEDLLNAEKKARLAADALKTAKIAVAVVRLCWEARDLKALNANIMILCKRRGQLKQAVADLVQAAMGYVDSIPAREDKVELITTLKTVTDGKIYVEVERARITRQLAMLQEADGAISQASETLQEVAVETYGSMEKKEKAEFLLEQMRLTLRERDFARMAILANKVNKRVLDEEGMEELRLRYYALMAQLHHSRHDALALAKGAQAVLSQRGLDVEPASWKPVLESVVVYAALAPWDNDVSDLFARLKADKRTKEVPAARALLELLTAQELIPWPLPAPHGDAIATHEAFRVDPCAAGRGAEALPGGLQALGVFGMKGSGEPVPAVPGAAAAAAAAGAAGAAAAGGGEATPGTVRPAASLRSSVLLKEEEAGAQWWPILQKRVVQHNLRVLAGAYTRLTFPRVAHLLGLDAPTAEAQLCELVASKALYARIDRPAGIVTFARPRPAPEVLSDWAADLDQVLTLVEKTAHLVQKEYMRAALPA